ncbi:MAG: hypothetical protein OEN01_00380 [Candidatus Krumholzibacteria bacterium]|nr:hypothetical protein [Candidatus Krumholzibacteria bacterium]
MTAREFGALLVPVAVFVALLVPLKSGFTDDGYIHIQYAQNLITRGEYSFNPGEVSFGTTSPLWVMMLASVGKLLGGGENLISISRALSWFSGIAAVVLMFVFARALQLAWWTAWFCAMTMATHAWHVRWSALSMETSLSVLAMVSVGIVSVSAYKAETRAWGAGVVMALATLIRPEAYLLVPVYLLAMIVVGHERKWACVLRTLAAYAALVAPWLLFARFHLGQFLPNTAAAKRGGLTLDPLEILDKLKPIFKISASTEGILGVMILVAILGLRGRTRVFTPACRFLLLWIIGLPIAYVVLDVQVLSRYMLLATPFTIVLGYTALEDIMFRLKTRHSAGRAALAVVALVVAIWNTGFYLGVVVEPSRSFSYGLTHELKEVARYLRENSDLDDVVAAMDIGYLAFYSERRVLDLGGLVDTETNQLREKSTYEEVVHRGLYLDLDGYPRVDFLVDRARVPNRFQDSTINGHRLQSVRVARMDNLGIRSPGPYYFTLYRIRRQG